MSDFVPKCVDLMWNDPAVNSVNISGGRGDKFIRLDCL